MIPKIKYGKKRRKYGEKSQKREFPEKEAPMDYLKRIRELKKEKDLTNEEIAEIADVPENTVAKIMSGQTQDPRFESVARIIIALGGSVDQVLGLAPENPEPTPTRVDAVVSNYAELLKTKEELIAEKEKRINSLERAVQNLRREKSRILFFFAGFMFLIIMFFIYIIIDLSNGGFGMIRY